MSLERSSSTTIGSSSQKREEVCHNYQYSFISNLQITYNLVFLVESRTFGRPIRKLKNALIPVMFAMGIVFSMIKFIMFLAMKSVAIGMTILILNVAVIATKMVLFFKGGHATGLVEHGGGSGYGKDVHVHVHPTPGEVKPLGGWSDRVYKSSYYVGEDGQSIPYNSWPQVVQSQRAIPEDSVVKKRSTNEEEVAIEYELPDQMSGVPPTPNFMDVEKIKNRRSLKI